MAFQTSVLREGSWVHHTVGCNAALAANAEALKLSAIPAPDPPVCGLMSKTVIESPVVRWVFAVRLRSKTHNDVAFIGDRFVQISELQSDGRMQEVLRKNDFGPRIRRAAVLSDYLGQGVADDDEPGSSVKLETPDAPMEKSSLTPNLSETRSLPPQFLVLILESGDCIFLFIRARLDGSLEFVITTYASPRNLTYLGYHLAVNPSSRYMTAASPEGVFVIYELESFLDLAAEYAQHGRFNPVKSIRLRVIQGVIQNMEFLFPRPGDSHHIILLLIVVRKERHRTAPISRIITYEWWLGDDLKSALAEEKNGNRLPDEHRMPMFIIPLRFNTAFFAVSQTRIGLVKYSLLGSPEFESLGFDNPNRAKAHHGAEEPVWTAWARPARRKKYLEKTDIIFLAREDGAIIYIEIDATDLVTSVVNIKGLETNIDTAFAVAYDTFSDVIIVGGDSGPGGTWKLPPLTDIAQVSILPNWSPVVDVTTTYEDSSWDADSPSLRGIDTRRRAAGHVLGKPHRVFSASGRGSKGSITEWRWGIQARIGLDIESGEPIRQSWAFPINAPGAKTLFGLLALPHSSAVLRFSEDLGQVNALSPEDTQFDTTSCTLHAAQTQDDTILQVTETCIAIVTASNSSRYYLEELLQMRGVIAQLAFSMGNAVVISDHQDQTSHLHTLQVEGTAVSRISSWAALGEVTCISMFTASGNPFVVVGSVFEGIPWVSIYSLQGANIATEALEMPHPPKPPKENTSPESSPSPSSRGAAAVAKEAMANLQLGALTSMCVVPQLSDGVDLVAGTRCGHLITFKIAEHDSSPITWSVELIGMAPVDVHRVPGLFNGGVTAFACCDSDLIMLSGASHPDGKPWDKHTIWLTDSNDASMPSPSIHSVYTMKNSLSGYDGHMSLMVLSGSRLMLADIWPHVGPVPRCIPVEGTPTRIIYSRMWNCLILALLKDDKPTLAFLDHETGAVISIPTDKAREPVEFISGLGHPGDKIYGLHEWLYVKDGRTFSFILVTTKDGRLLIVSMNTIEVQTDEGVERRLQYWTRHKKSFYKPIYSIVGDEDGLAFCVDRTLHWEILDLAEKKLKPMKQFELDSPATSLRVANGKILALTTMHSVEVIDHRRGEEAGMVLLHTDQVSRKTVHMIDAGWPSEECEQLPLTLLSDHMGGIAGVWIPWAQRHREFQVIIQGDVGTSVRRFVHARSRRLCHSAQRELLYEVLPSTEDGGEILGLALNGSLHHFTILGENLWRFLCLIQNAAQGSRVLYPLPGRSSNRSQDEDVRLQPVATPESRHIDGDMLERCLKLKALEQVIRTGECLDLFVEYLDMVKQGEYTRKFRADPDEPEDSHEAEVRIMQYFQVGYDVLEYLLVPVI